MIVRARSGAASVRSAEVSAGTVRALTDDRGEARLDLPAGDQEITVSHTGFATVTVLVTVGAGAQTTVTAQLREVAVEGEVVVVHATGSDTVIEDQPIRVEALPQEEIEENLTIAPGNLTTLLNELGGLRVQITAPGLGGGSLRLQGLRGRYTQVLVDGLPIYGQQPDAFSLLQTPPLDLAQAEVIKGPCSALYGGSALGGVVNLVSQRPGAEPGLLLNQSSQGGSDAVGFVTGRISDRWGYTLLGGGHRQTREDTDGDGWADLAGYGRAEVRPRLFWSDDAGSSMLLTAGATLEDRDGGTMAGATTSAGTPFREELDTRRFDAGLVGHFLVPDDRLVTLRASSTGTWHDRTFGPDDDRELRGFGLVEASLSGTDRGHTWLVGAGAQGDWFRSRALPDLGYTRVTPGVFAQDEYAAANHVALSASARVDVDHEDGARVSPLFSALLKPGGSWKVRLSGGAGWAPPVPFTEEFDAVGLFRVLPPGDLSPERARRASVDAGWTGKTLEVNGTLFASEVNDPLVRRSSSARPGEFEIVNAGSPARTVGSELLLRLAVGPLQIIATDTWLASSEEDPSGRGRAGTPLTPRQTAEIAGILERESRGRVGLELSYTGRQRLEDDPYRSFSRPYLEINALGEVRIGDVHLFVNAVNLGNVRQTRYDPLLLPAQAADGRWTTEVWAPLQGRAVNVGVRLELDRNRAPVRASGMPGGRPRQARRD